MRGSPVALLEYLELLAEEAAEGGAHHRPGQGALGKASHLVQRVRVLAMGSVMGMVMVVLMDSCVW